jgi:transcriptional regulator with XRE-family HTH domain
LRELGDRVGLSASLLSQIERGKSEPSVSSLYALVKELGVSLDALLGSTPVVEHQTRSEVIEVADIHRSNSPRIRPSERAHLDMTSGVHWEQLTRGSDPYADVLLVTYAPGGKSSADGTLMTHSGVEYAYLLDGELTLHIGFERLILRAGDSLRFESSQPHLYSNEAQEAARGLWFVLGRGNHGGADFGLRSETEHPKSAVDVLRSFGAQLGPSNTGAA